MNDTVKKTAHGVRRWAPPVSAVFVSIVTIWVSTAGKTAIQKIDEMHTWYNQAQGVLGDVDQLKAMAASHQVLLSEGGRYTRAEGNAHEARTQVLERVNVQLVAWMERIERRLGNIESRISDIERGNR